MKMKLEPGMRLKTEGCNDVEILKTDLNARLPDVTHPVVAVITNAYGGHQRVVLYSEDGRCSTANAHDDLFNPLKNLKDGDPVFVSNDVEGGWRRRHFARFDSSGIALCYDYGRSKWTDEGELTAWHFVRVPTQDELDAVPSNETRIEV